ncbi:hypothetical protein TNCV_4149531 [Trichonephila clavipes]|uniref:Uncharacterized protein n=1 Tax=Trichonephila clavipes TaxID=2585209 RepID=A0A8X6W574_TRICX|nr:hypothetical protein TNCV_4149531 [Trichonephila clavipes]
MNTKIHKYPSTNRRAPLPSTDTGSLRSRTRRRHPHRDRSHLISTTTNKKAPSRNAGERNHTQFSHPTQTRKAASPLDRQSAILRPPLAEGI